MWLLSVQHQKVSFNVTSNIMPWSTGKYRLLISVVVTNLQYFKKKFSFRTPYAKNPFDSVSDQEIEEYKRQVEMSQKGISGKLHHIFMCISWTSSWWIHSNWKYQNTEEHEVSYSTTEAPSMEPLVAESVVLSSSGEPVRPERKSSPTSPRPLSDDEGTAFISIIFLGCFSFRYCCGSIAVVAGYFRLICYYLFFLFFRIQFTFDFDYFMFHLFFRVGFSGTQKTFRWVASPRVVQVAVKHVPQEDHAQRQLLPADG